MRELRIGVKRNIKAMAAECPISGEQLIGMRAALLLVLQDFDIRASIILEMPKRTRADAAKLALIEDLGRDYKQLVSAIDHHEEYQPEPWETQALDKVLGR